MQLLSEMGSTKKHRNYLGDAFKKIGSHVLKPIFNWYAEESTNMTPCQQCLLKAMLSIKQTTRTKWNQEKLLVDPRLEYLQPVLRNLQVIPPPDLTKSEVASAQQKMRGYLIRKYREEREQLWSKGNITKDRKKLYQLMNQVDRLILQQGFVWDPQDHLNQTRQRYSHRRYSSNAEILGSSVNQAQKQNQITALLQQPVSGSADQNPGVQSAVSEINQQLHSDTREAELWCSFLNLNINAPQLFQWEDRMDRDIAQMVQQANRSHKHQRTKGAMDLFMEQEDDQPKLIC